MSEKTTLNERGYPVYKRGANDLLIVPHNRDILMDWKGHACLEFSASVHNIFYLYKYMFKGTKKVKMHLKDVRQDDEILLYLRGHKLCSMEAMWKLFNGRHDV